MLLKVIDKGENDRASRKCDGGAAVVFGDSFWFPTTDVKSSHREKIEGKGRRERKCVSSQK